MLGHGFPQGLVVGGRVVIDDSFADLLRGQAENIFVFCNADLYMQRNGLKGFATGMFVSDSIEAHIFNVDASPTEIAASNALFARLLGRVIDCKAIQIIDYLDKNYHIRGNEAVEYNRARLRYFE